MKWATIILFLLILFISVNVPRKPSEMVLARTRTFLIVDGF